MTTTEYSQRRSAAEFVRWVEQRLRDVDDSVFRTRKALWKRMAEEALPIKNFLKHPDAPAIEWVELMAGSQKGDAKIHAATGDAFIEVTSGEDKDDADVRKALNDDGWHTGQPMSLASLEDEATERLAARLRKKADMAITYPERTVLLLSSPSTDLGRLSDTELVERVTSMVSREALSPFHAVWLLQVNAPRLVLIAGSRGL